MVYSGPIHDLKIPFSALTIILLTMAFTEKGTLSNKQILEAIILGLKTWPVSYSQGPKYHFFEFKA